MPLKVIDIVFGSLAKAVLDDALTSCGRREEILAFPDDLSFGPIDSLDAIRREKWIVDNFHLSLAAWDIFPGGLKEFFTKIDSLDHSYKIVCWLCQNSVYEYCGFYECIRSMPNSNLYLIDTMEFENKSCNGNGSCRAAMASRLAHLSPAIASRLIGTEVPVSTDLLVRRQAEWEKLRAENAPLRTIGSDGVKSVSISHFDEFLLAQIGRDWRPARRVVTYAAVAANPDDFFRVDMVVLAGRLQALIGEGRIEAGGDLSDWTAMNVRSR